MKYILDSEWSDECNFFFISTTNLRRYNWPLNGQKRQFIEKGIPFSIVFNRYY